MGSLPDSTPISLGIPERYASVKTDGQRMVSTLEESCQWGNTADGGMNRVSCNDDDGAVRNWFVQTTKALGCSVTIDALGNIFAVYPGQNNALPPIAIGSHLDTQPTGGKYDGILGVLSGIEVLQTLHTHEITPYAPLAIVNWTNEEGARFPPAMLASGVWGGAFTTEYAHARTDQTGTTLKQALESIGYLGETACGFDAVPLSAHFEVHIEQGPILDTAEKAVGIVRGVQAIKWYTVKITGREAHTGTTPMDRRSDALLGAAQMIVAANEAACNGELGKRGSRATVATITSAPQSINTIAGQVTIGLDIRSPLDEDVNAVESICRERFAAIAKTHGLTVDIDCFWTSPALHFDSTMVSCVRAAAKEMGCDMELVSGAGHDSVYTSLKVPTAMIFVRCQDGVSHNPAEYSRPEDCADGAQVLLGAYLRYDEYLRGIHEKA